MLGSAELVAFVATTDIERALEFYAGVLGLTVQESNPFGSALRGGGTMIRLAKVDQLTPHPFTVLGWIVTDIGQTIDELAAHEVAFCRYPGMDQDRRGIWVAPGGARVAWFADPDGNTLSLTELG